MSKVISQLNYTAPLDLYKREKPFYSNVPLANGVQSNQKAQLYDNITFHDIRDNIDAFDIDDQGFEVLTYEDTVPDGDFDSDAWVRSDYYPIAERVLKDRFGDVDILIFDHTVRRRQTVSANGKKPTKFSRQPSLSAHADQTFLSGANRVRLHTGEAADTLLKRRCQIVNVWRPLFGPLEDYPLTFCDFNTVKIERDYLEADLIFPHYIGEQFLSKYHPDHRWYFLSNQQVDEFIVFKCYDNKPNVASCVAHTAFQNPNASPTARLRESIELRCLVFHKDPVHVDG